MSPKLLRPIGGTKNMLTVSPVKKKKKKVALGITGY